MNKIKAALLGLVALAGFGASSTEALAQANPQKKPIVVYYSHSNNTRVLAEEIQKQTGGAIFRIETIQTYPSEYNKLTDQAKKELQQNYRPKLKKLIGNLDDYDVIYLGSPNWWGTIAPAVFTFVESYKWQGKTIIPFITHEGSRLGNSVKDIQRIAPGANVLEGLAIRGGDVQKAGGDVSSWLRRIGQVK